MNRIATTAIVISKMQKSHTQLLSQSLGNSKHHNQIHIFLVQQQQYRKVFPFDSPIALTYDLDPYNEIQESM